MRNSIKISGYLAIALVMVLSLAFSPLAEALQIRITDGISTVDVPDSGTGIIFYNGSVGVFNVVMTLGTSKPVLGSTTAPEIDLTGNATTTSSTGSHTLTMLITDTGFGPLSQNGFVTTIGGTTKGSVTFDTYFDNTNTPFGTGVQIGHLGPFTWSSGPAKGFSDETVFHGTPGTPFSLTMVANITHIGDNKQTSFDGTISPTPEPGTILLLGLGLLGLGIISRKKVKIEG